ncbi:M14 family metallopeptidase [Fulvivirgaceae bacterium BMA12]|uniref:M14 family metallopeptidase n=1 Tax=Agaribacillus aureus TaxID=3051825 RepID=A0ABT8KY52_9BACT|nr:M14 family metallopeptidase [Fulvivirgaceae bacterium BMA12]
MNRILILMLGCAFWSGLYGQTPFDFDEQSILPGTKRHFTINISDGQNQTFVPITVFHGKENGAVLGITAGVHGYEYAPILAGQELINKIDPLELTGTVILVQAANVGSFLGRSPYINPMDKKNLNRSFPGNPNGTITERIANFISEKIIPRCNYFVDMHSGDAPEDLRPYVAYYQHDEKPGISAKGREIAMNLGFDHIIVLKTTEKDYMKQGLPSLYCSAEAFKRGIPAADIECGRLGMVEERFVEKIIEGVGSLLNYLQMTPGVPMPSKGIAFIEERFYITSDHTGLFYPLKTGGAFVRKGMKIGYITDFFNKTIKEVYAENSGIILYMLGTPPVNEGETLAAIGIVD